jgi:hypothetical protein
VVYDFDRIAAYGVVDADTPAVIATIPLEAVKVIRP